MAARTWTAITLCFGIWFVYMKWFAPLPPSVDKKIESPVSNAAPATSEKASSNSTLQSAQWTKDFKLENGKLELTFSDLGAKPVEATTKKYRLTPKKSSGPMPVLSVDENGPALETVFTDSQLSEFTSGKYERRVKEDQVSFLMTSPNAQVEKEYSLKENSYFLDSTIVFRPKAKSRQDWGYLMIPVGSRAEKSDTHDPLKNWEVVRYQNESLTRSPIGKIEVPEKVEQGNTAWLAFGNKYFAMAVANAGGEINPDIVLTKQKDFVGAYLRYPLILKEGQEEIRIPVRYYLGAKDYHELEGARMLGLIDYGTFAKLAYPLLWLLRAFYGVVHNYGVAIILLTILVRLLFYPLTLKSQKSMKAMQRLQPQISALKEKYKDDPAKMQQEQMALFKTHKVNPMGGCLPMLVQLPVFIALYAVLGNSIELFQAPFFGWIQDLSTKDPFYIYPVLMGVSMFVQQKLTPAAGMDPAQQKIMMFMPVLFSAMMINLPAGLTMYIFVSTLLGIMQQVMMKEKNSASSPAQMTST
ncbi:membrane protein insertase YidC [bacterium]|nr:membrane protein insertase YidC [bacterium]